MKHYYVLNVVGGGGGVTGGDCGIGNVVYSQGINTIPHYPEPEKAKQRCGYCNTININSCNSHCIACGAPL